MHHLFSVKPRQTSITALLILIATCLLNVSLSTPVNAQSRGLALEQSQNDAPDIDPNVERRDIKEFDIDSENIEVTAFVGVISIEDFESNVVYGARVAYHINENLFIEGTYGMATAGETSFEVLSGGAPFLTDDEREYSYYDASVGYNFNGELFVTDSLVFNTDLYLTLGAGSTEFGGDDRFTLSVGAGYRVLFTDYFAVRLDVRDNMFKTDIIGEEKNVQNLSYTISTSFFF